MTAPSTAGRGDSVSVDAEVSNSGVGLSSFPVTFHLSIDQEVDAEMDAQVGSCWIDNLAGGNQASCSPTHAAIPEDLPQAGQQGRGPFYWIACSDSIDGVYEGDETNNCLIHGELFQIPEPRALSAAFTALGNAVHTGVAEEVIKAALETAPKGYKWRSSRKKNHKRESIAKKG